MCDIQRLARYFKDADECILLDPALDVRRLIIPLVELELVCARCDDLSRDIALKRGSRRIASVFPKLRSIVSALTAR
jgi:hypothetical protein